MRKRLATIGLMILLVPAPGVDVFYSMSDGRCGTA